MFLREKRDEVITREDIFAKYFSLLEDNDSRSITEEFANKIEKAKKIFEGIKKLRIFVRGEVFTINGGTKYFTFIDEEFDVNKSGLEDALKALDNFNLFMNSITIDYTQGLSSLMRATVDSANDKNSIFFSNIERKYVSRQIVASAELIINVE